MITPNQLDTIFQSKLGRNSTPFEQSTYGNSPASVLGNLDKVYGAYNKDSSIVDYLKHSGQDSSLNARNGLLTQYGLQGGTTPENNTKLLSMLSSGAKPPALTPQPIAGAVAPASPTPTPQPTFSSQQGPNGEGTSSYVNPAPYGTRQDGTPIDNPNPQSSPTPIPLAANFADTHDMSNPANAKLWAASADAKALGGSVSGAAASTYQADPALQSTLDSYTSTQKQIQDLDATLANSLENKRQEIAKNGGIVDEAQLRGMVQSENAPLIQQRTQLAGQQAITGKQYQSLLASDRQNRNDFSKSQALSEKEREFNATQTTKGNQFSQTEADKQQKITYDATKFSVTEQDKQKAEQDKIALADAKNWKISKVAIYDDNGNKVGERLVRTNGSQSIPVTGADAINSGRTVPATVGDSTAATSTVQGPSSFSFPSFYTNSEAPTLATGKMIDSKTGISAEGLYQEALTYIATNKIVSNSRSGKSKSQAEIAAVKNKAGALLQAAGISQAGYQLKYKANGKAISETTSRLARIETVNNTLSMEFPRLGQLADQVDFSKITESDLSASKAVVDAKFGNTPAAQYVELVQSMRAEYGAMIAAIGGGRGGQYAFSSATEAIPLGYTSEQYKGVQSNLEYISSKNVDSAKSEIQNLMGGLDIGAKTPQSPQDIVSSAVKTSGYKYDDIISHAPAGQIAVVQSSDGQVVYIPAEEFDASTYTKM